MPRVLPIGGKWASQTPTVIVSGLPRSGTSMMMQILVAGGLEALSDGIRTADEDNPRGYYELEAVKRTREDPSWLIGSEGKAVKLIHLLVTDLPTDRPYRVILMRRRSAAVVKSQTAMLERLGREGARLDPGELARLYEQQIDSVKAYMNRHSCFEFFEAWYGAVVAYPRTQIEAINRFLSGELDVDAMVAAVDPALQRK